MARHCPQCSQEFTPKRSSAVYCSRACKTDAANLEAARGKQLYRLAYHWREGQSRKGSSACAGAKFSDLSFLIDQFRREDREAGRPAPPLDRGDHHTTAPAYFTNAHRRAQQGKDT